MKTTFSSFTNLKEGNDYSIPHVEDLDLETFIRSIESINKLDAVQKLDGANLRGGLDDKGNLYTSREQKGGKRFYTEKSFPKNSAYDGFKTAHVVLKKCEQQIKDILSPGEAFNMEVIYGLQPNTVFYGKDGLNYLAFLEMIPGDNPSIEPDQSKIKQLERTLKDKIITVETLMSDTTDGIMIAKAPKVTDWKFVTQARIDSLDLENLNFEDEITKLKTFLEKINEVAKSLGRDMTNFEVLKDRSTKLSQEKTRLEEKILKEFKLPIKEKLLALVQKQKPMLRSDSVEGEGAYHGIEGIIFTHPKTREKFKIVDREVFTKINQFNYQVRKSISGKTLSVDPNLPSDIRGGIVGQALSRSIKMFGLANAELPSQTMKTITKLKGQSRDETIKAISDSLHQLNFEAVRRKVQAIYVSAIDDLNDSLDTFKKHGDEYELKLNDGTIIKYTKEIKRRTLMSFAESRKTLEEYLKNIRSAKYLEDLIEVFFKKSLDQLHGDSE